MFTEDTAMQTLSITYVERIDEKVQKNLMFIRPTYFPQVLDLRQMDSKYDAQDASRL